MNQEKSLSSADVARTQAFENLRNEFNENSKIASTKTKSHSMNSYNWKANYFQGVELANTTKNPSSL